MNADRLDVGHMLYNSTHDDCEINVPHNHPGSNLFPKHGVAVGNIFDGLTFYGPFDDIEDAMEWGESNNNAEWNVFTLNNPEEE